MCGLVGIVTRQGDRPAITEADLRRMRDRLAHRGPDDAGLLLTRNFGLAHTRLSILDPSPAGQQPMATPDGRFVLVYNGELYNEAELRAGLEAEGVRFRSSCDTETVLRLLASNGAPGLDHFRGMYALALVDRDEGRLLLARDPLGIKPLYYWHGILAGRPHVIFASEPTAILSHPGVSARPDMLAVSGYLTTIRTVQGRRTMFEGIHAVTPGEWISFDLRENDLSPRRGCVDIPAAVAEGGDERELVREAVTDSVVRHMRSDVPMCSLLSGGLDSTILASIASARNPELMTYCAGTPREGVNDDDLSAARTVAAELGIAHRSVAVTREAFARCWPEMVASLGVPLSTPNEVAIFEVARALRGDGYRVVLSGEGADEFFAGYDGPLSAVRTFLQNNPRATVRERAAYELETNGWVAPSIKRGLLHQSASSAVGADEALLTWQTEQLDGCCPGETEANLLDRRLAAHVRLQQQVNLVGLLGRLDTATMLASVEGRTPLADIAIAALANRLPLSRRISWHDQEVRTKIALREAFGERLPAVAVRRPKASFPLPFVEWLGDQAGVLESNELLGEVFAPGVVQTVAARPADLWRLAWPMMNLALWGEVWWGQEKRPSLSPGVQDRFRAVG